MASQNNTRQNGRLQAQPEDASASSSARRRANPLASAASLINSGGVGHSPSYPSTTNTPPSETSLEIARALDAYDSQFLPHHPKSLSGIALRSFCLGSSLAFSSVATVYLLSIQAPIWRAPFFIFTLSLFHFLEFYTTSLTNTPGTNVASFLLTSNGLTYFIAHTISLLETLLTHSLHPTPFLPPSIHTALLTTGILLLLLGQSIRAIAMLQAGTNFSHVIKHTKSSTHTLVTTGIYSLLRHPSYFGFFWWGIGTQFICGNVVGLLGYTIVLWVFFARRIRGEEKLLVGFFGEEYIDYRARTRTGIPFIK